MEPLDALGHSTIGREGVVEVRSKSRVGTDQLVTHIFNVNLKALTFLACPALGKPQIRAVNVTQRLACFPPHDR